MIRNYRPLLLQEIGVRLPGIHLRRLRLNRHLREVDHLAAHQHSFAQILCYFQGGGVMTASGEAYEVNAGSLLMLPPRCRHSFQEREGRRALCLVIDLEWRGAVRQGVALRRLSQAESGLIRKELSALMGLKTPEDPGFRLVVAASALRILDTLFQSLQLLPERKQELPAFVRRYDRLLQEQRGRLASISELAAEMGYQQDYLNRIFKQATGLTLREYRDAFLLEKAKQYLRANLKVGDACERLGFSDQNYFARWFRKHTGISPGGFKG